MANRQLSSEGNPTGPAACGGFTLLELMMTLTVLGILAALAMPSYSKFTKDQKVKTAVSEVYASLAFARSEAIKRGADVVITPTSAANWGSGWTVTASGTAIKVQTTIPGVTVSGPANLTYRRDGRLNAAAVTIFVLSYPGDSTITARCVRLDPSGRPNIKVDTNDDPSDGCQ